ncbi:MAG: 50S ribosomal protein L3 [Candidatus Cloacimonadota bacterium]|nr:50S ribosomal protein L3 [Candidatus Cloacimonadota bacterium]
MLGLIGKKIGMTRVFSENGKSINVTVIQAGPCVVTQKRNVENEGYSAIQMGFSETKEKRIKKPQIGQFKKNGLKYYKYLKEFRLSDEELNAYDIGSEIDVNIFKENENVNVTGTSKGRGFAGVIKRHGFHGKIATHGTHESFRGTGSVGQCATPARIFKGKKMPGHMGNAKVTVQNLQIIRIDKEKNILLVKGAVPGHRNTLLTIKKK